MEILVVESFLILCGCSRSPEWIFDSKFAMIQKLRDCRREIIFIIAVK